MKKISLIIKREYLSRVKKRSFIIMTILGPVLMASLFIVPIYIAQNSDEVKVVSVLDESGIFVNKFRNSKYLKFEYVYSDLDTAKQNIHDKGYYALLYIPQIDMHEPSDGIIFSDVQPNINVQGYIQTVMKREIEAIKLKSSGIDKDVLESIKTNIKITTITLDESGKEEQSFTSISITIGLIGGLLIYFFIFMYGAQVMRGVIEEKTSRIVEVIVSSVKPFQLMMGKIIGIALVGFTQFLLWVVLTFTIIGVFQVSYPEIFNSSTAQEQVFTGSNKIPTNNQIQKFNEARADEANDKLAYIFNAINSYNFTQIILCFLFFFLSGYLLYAALFAAIGSAVDNDADIQQFMLPITVPLIFAIIMGQFVINNPSGPVAFWLSIIPFTSPIIMMIRLPFGVPVLELYLSMFLMILGFLGTTWLAGRIYRTGILMYGKKVNYRELWKWLFYRR